MEWISIKTALPKEMQTVFTMEDYDSSCYPHVDIDSIDGTIFSKGNFWIEHPLSDYPLFLTRVTHWAALPKAPTN
jgi:G:T-mismatch repair DNA endonuclease (very short patch repair protein)